MSAIELDAIALPLPYAYASSECFGCGSGDIDENRCEEK